MSDEQPQTTAQKNANLARIRDNQRRSRARRKEYLQELESKYRICEQVGVEASAEIQAAARRVIAENKRLRQLLKERGLSNAEIDEPSEDGARVPSAAHDLERMLGLRKPCKPGHCCGDEGDEGGAAVGREQGGAPEQQPNIQPAPIVSSSDAPNNPPQLRVSQARYPTPAPGASMTPPHSRHPPALAQSYSHLAPSSLGNVYPAQLEGQQVDAFEVSQGLGWLDPYPASDFTLEGIDAPADHTSSSCEIAADVIRGIKPDLGNELEEELCGPANNGNCCVPNDKIFSIMDRYSNGVA